MNNSKRTIFIDLDGVLNNYTGNYNQNYIPEIKAGAKEFIIKLSQNFNIKIFTVRDKVLVNQWLEEYKLDKYIKEVTKIKEPAWLYIDDRCIRFEGNYSILENQIQEFKP